MPKYRQITLPGSPTGSGQLTGKVDDRQVYGRDYALDQIERQAVDALRQAIAARQAYRDALTTEQRARLDPLRRRCPLCGRDA